MITDQYLGERSRDKWSQAQLASPSLRRLGKEAVLVEYPGAGHTLDDSPEITQDYQQRCWDWFDRHLKPRSAASARARL